MNLRMAIGLSLVLFTFNAAALDSQNKVPQHFCVEGPVAQNVYTGSVTLDEKGQAAVYLPKYFEALNTNAQYILTAVGNAMPSLHVLEKIHDNRFWIAGGAPAGEVSWMIIAQRNDKAVAAENTGVNADASHPQ